MNKQTLLSIGKGTMTVLSLAVSVITIVDFRYWYWLESIGTQSGWLCSPHNRRLKKEGMYMNNKLSLDDIIALAEAVAAFRKGN